MDDQLQGKDYTSNKGRSGFGKFKTLPQPKTLIWNVQETSGAYFGSHNGCQDIGVDFNRLVIDLKEGFWIVKDAFVSSEPHTYKQVWQGHNTSEKGPNLLRATFNDGTGVDIFQLHPVDSVWSGGARGKQWYGIAKQKDGDFSFLTVIYPFEKFDQRLAEHLEDVDLKGWRINDLNAKVNEGTIKITKNNQLYAYSALYFQWQNITISFNRKVEARITFENVTIETEFLSV